jgi:transcriptional regulator with XRE-family HTH domain
MAQLNNINELRKARGLTVEGLAEASGVPLSTVKKICAGITTNPNLETVKALARALDCKLDDISDGEGQVDRLKVEFIALFDSLSAEDQEDVARYAEFLKSRHNSKG